MEKTEMMQDLYVRENPAEEHAIYRHCSSPYQNVWIDLIALRLGKLSCGEVFHLTCGASTHTYEYSDIPTCGVFFHLYVS